MLAIFGMMGAAVAAFMFVDTNDAAKSEDGQNGTGDEDPKPDPGVELIPLTEVTASSDEDTIVFSGNGDDVVQTGAGNDYLAGEDGDDRLISGGGHDTLEGGRGDDILEAGDGNDALNGHIGNDIADGGNGDDKLNGGGGDDVLMGGDRGPIGAGLTYTPPLWFISSRGVTSACRMKSLSGNCQDLSWPLISPSSSSWISISNRSFMCDVLPRPAGCADHRGLPREGVAR